MFRGEATITLSFKGEYRAARVAKKLIAKSIPFFCEPMPDDIFDFEVKVESVYGLVFGDEE